MNDKDKQFQNGDSSSLKNTHGPQGVDKAPGEEQAAGPDQFLQETQKGKKVDADLSNESERPLEQSKT